MSKKPEIKSWKNLESAFAGESMAYQKYLYFAKVARKNGDEEVAQLFEETAKHETKHAEGHLRNLYPMKGLTTEQCLKMAVAGENYEYTEMYPGFARTASEEGMEDWMVEEFEEGIVECKEHAEAFIAKLEKLGKIFTGLAKVEKEHHDNYERALNDFTAASSRQFEASEGHLDDYDPEKL
ncbi:MAG: rubrerythrin [Halobacteriovoraceae bacterium]|mgnify:FL=1|jgi:rubrerythrin|nr:rubrerythrin [Halobacteriovoraceae bacterium]MBT5093653.1 rubrerythrin [Halobacteriovoraceae bacterium]